MTSSNLAKAKDTEYLSKLAAVLNAESAPVAVLETAIAYCQAAKLDPMRKPIAIISYKDKHQIVFTVQALTTIASRSGWAGQEAIVFGPEKKYSWTDRYGKTTSVTAPEWGHATVYKLMNGQRIPFVGPKVFFEERNQKNGNWGSQPMAMFQKCILAAALRLAFPEEASHIYIEDEFSSHEPMVQVDNSAIEDIKKQLSTSTSVASAPTEAVVEQVEGTIISSKPEATEAVVVEPTMSLEDIVSSFAACKTKAELVETKDAAKQYLGELSVDDQESVKEAFKARQKEIINE